MVCVYALLVLKTAQQGFVDSLPLITVRRGCHVALPSLTAARPDLPPLYGDHLSTQSYRGGFLVTPDDTTKLASPASPRVSICLGAQ